MRNEPKQVTDTTLVPGKDVFQAFVAELVTADTPRRFHQGQPITASHGSYIMREYHFGADIYLAASAPKQVLVVTPDQLAANFVSAGQDGHYRPRSSHEIDLSAEGIRGSMPGAETTKNPNRESLNVKAELKQQSEMLQRSLQRSLGSSPSVAAVLSASLFDDRAELGDNLKLLANHVHPDVTLSREDFEALVGLVEAFTAEHKFLRASIVIAQHLNGGKFPVDAETIRGYLE